MRLLPCVLALGVACSLAAACGSSDKRSRASASGGEGGAGQGASPHVGGTPDQGDGRAAQGGVADKPSGGDASGGVAQGGQPAGGEAGTSAAAGAGAGAAGGAGAPNEAVTVVDLGFEGQDSIPDNLDPGTAVLTPAQGFAELGPDGGKFGSTFLRGPTSTTVVTLTLNDLPPHTTLSLSMLFAAIDSLDGTGSFPAGDFFTIKLDGVTVFRESFANAIPGQLQSYDPPPAAVLARRVDLGFAGPGSYYTDSAYDFGQDPRFQDLPHTASDAVFVFTLEGEGVQPIEDESWAIDNLRVTAR